MFYYLHKIHELMEKENIELINYNIIKRPYGITIENNNFEKFKCSENNIIIFSMLFISIDIFVLDWKNIKKIENCDFIAIIIAMLLSFKTKINYLINPKKYERIFLELEEYLINNL
ncbi:MAG: hypothetical protein H7836_13720 [Magnetococcus sp. YQC-3]